MRVTKEIRRVVASLGFHPDYWVHIPTGMLPSLVKQIQKLDAYRSAWRLTSLKQKRDIYAAMSEKDAKLIMDDIRQGDDDASC